MHSVLSARSVRSVRSGHIVSNDEAQVKAIIIRELCAELHDRIMSWGYQDGTSQADVRELSVHILASLEKYQKTMSAANLGTSSKVPFVSPKGSQTVVSPRGNNGNGNSNVQSNKVHPAPTPAPAPASASAPAPANRLSGSLKKLEQKVRQRLESFIEPLGAAAGAAGMNGASRKAPWNQVQTPANFFFSLRDADGVHDGWLNFVDPDFMGPEMALDYVSFKRSDMNIPIVAIMAIVGCVILAMSCAVVLSPGDTALSTLVVLALIFTFVAALCLTLMCVLRAIMLSFKYEIHSLQRFHPAAVTFVRSRVGQSFEDGAVVCASLAAGSLLLCKALQPVCPTGTDLWLQRDCNPSEHSLPVYAVVLVVLVVNVMQKMCRGGTHAALAVAWVVTAVAINASMYIVGDMNYLWINLELLLMMILSYERERSSVRQFVKTVRIVQASEANGQLRVQLANFQVPRCRS